MKMLGPLCKQTVYLETDTKALYYSLLKLKYSCSMYLKHKKATKLQLPQKSHEQDILPKESSNQLIVF